MMLQKADTNVTGTNKPRVHCLQWIHVFKDRQIFEAFKPELRRRGVGEILITTSPCTAQSNVLHKIHVHYDIACQSLFAWVNLCKRHLHSFKRQFRHVTEPSPLSMVFLRTCGPELNVNTSNCQHKAYGVLSITLCLFYKYSIFICIFSI